MVSKTLILSSSFPVLALAIGFQDGLNPQEKIAARVPATDDGAFFCSAVGELLSICQIGTVSQASTDAAGCLCYSSSSWAPQIFDGGVSSCAEYAKTALPDAYSVASAFEDFCTIVGDYQNPSPAGRSSTIPPVTTSPPVGGVTTSPDPTPIVTTPAPSIQSASPSSSAGSVDLFSNPACSYLGFAFSFCNSVSPGFSTMDASSQAPCLCYSSTVWSPDGFDGPVQTCADFVSTADPDSYSTFAAVEGFCSSVGDITTGASSVGGSSASATGGSGGVGIGIGGGGVGIGISVPGGAKSTSLIAPSSTKAASVTTSPTRSQTTSAVPTVKPNDAAALNNMWMNWTATLVFVAISVMILL